MRINDVLGQLVATYTEWNHVLANPRFVRKGRLITWRDYSSAKIIVPSSHADVVKLYEAGQYSFQTTDGSLLQLSYTYAPSKDELTKARLAFYKVDQQSWEIVEPDDSDAINGMIVPNRSPELEQLAAHRPISISWLRIDYSPKTTSGVLHNSCHLHLSAFPSARVVVAGVPTPKQFVEFVIALCYSDIYREHRLDKDGAYKEPARMETVNSQPVPLAEDLTCRYLAHFRIPGVLPLTSLGRARRR
jgi:hypothetical protein